MAISLIPRFRAVGTMMRFAVATLAGRRFRIKVGLIGPVVQILNSQVAKRKHGSDASRGDVE
jgi:hypothetical protein